MKKLLILLSIISLFYCCSTSTWPIGTVSIKIEDDNLFIHNGLGENIYYYAISDNNEAFTVIDSKYIETYLKPLEVKKISINSLRGALGINKYIVIYWWRSSNMNDTNRELIVVN